MSSELPKVFNKIREGADDAGATVELLWPENIYGIGVWHVRFEDGRLSSVKEDDLLPI